MDIVIYDVQDFPFDKLRLNGLENLRGNTYFSPLTIDDNNIFVKLPKCTTRKGIEKTSKKMYTQLMLDEKKENQLDAIDWFENLEKTIRNLILEKREEWFQTNIDAEDIEQHWVSNLRTLRNKTPSNMLQCFISNMKGEEGEERDGDGSSILVFNEDEKQLSLEEVDNKCENTCLVEISRLKFTPQTFKIDIYLRQLMIHSPQKNIIQNQCLLGNSRNKPNQSKIIDNTKDTVESFSNKTSQNKEDHGKNEKTDDKQIDLPVENSCVEKEINTGQVNAGQLDEGQVDEGQVDEEQVDEGQVDEEQVGEGQVDEGQLDDRQLDERQVDERQVDEGQVDEGQVDEGQVNKGQVNEGQADEKQNEKTEEIINLKQETTKQKDYKSGMKDMGILDLNKELKKNKGDENETKIQLDEKELIIKRYNSAKKKAEETKQKAIIAYLEWKKIRVDAKLLMDLDDSDSDDDSDDNSDDDSDDNSDDDSDDNSDNYTNDNNKVYN